MKLPLDLSTAEWKRYGLFAVCFFSVIGSYWMLRVVKNTLFMDMVHHTSLPYAKQVSIANLIVMLLLYNKLVDWLGRQRLVPWLFCTYALVFLLLAGLLRSPQLGLDNETGSEILGWVIYVTIEGFGSLGVLLLWSYVVSITVHEQAKRVFPMLAAAGNLGAFLGTSFVRWQVAQMDVIPLLVIAAGFIAAVPLWVGLHARMYGIAAQDGVRPVISSPEIKEGALEGLRLIALRPYLLAILAIVVAYEMTGAFFDYQMNAAAAETLVDRRKVAAFLALYGQSQSLLSLSFAAIGTTILLRLFGLRFCLLAFPLILAGFNGYIQVHPGLWSFFAAQVALKGLSYSLNKPCLEILYVSTSRTIQFKAKSWIDTTGSRSGKALGSTMNAIFIPLGLLLHGGGTVIFVIIGAWLPIAWWVARKNQQLVSNQSLIR